MQNVYVSGVIDNFHSNVDMGYVCEFVMDTIEDNRYTNYGNYHRDSEFETNMLNFIYGVGQ